MGFQIIIRDDISCYDGLETESSSYYSVAQGRGLYEGLAEFGYSFVVQASDDFSNDRVLGGDLLEVIAEPPAFDFSTYDNKDGTYSVFFIPEVGNFSLSVSLNGKTLDDAPFQVDFLPPTTCPMKGGILPLTPSGPQQDCEYYDQKACCNYEEVPIIEEAEQLIADAYGDSEECVSNFDILVCGIHCDPRQSEFLKIVLGSHNETITNQFGICSDFCDTLYDSCKDVELDLGFTINEVYLTAQDFCTMGLPSSVYQNYTFIVRDTYCFNGNIYPTSAPDSRASGTGLEGSIAGNTASFTIQARDIYGNMRTSGGDNFKIVLEGPTTEMGRVFDLGDGTYSVFYVSTVSGTYNLNITLNGQHIFGSPSQLVIYPAEFSASKTLVFGSGLVTGLVGVLSPFTIVARDRYGNELLHGGQKFDIKVTGPQKQKLPVSIVDAQNGTYFVKYGPPPSPGTYRIDIESELEVVAQSPYFAVVAGPYDSCNSLVTGVSDTIAGVPVTVTIQTRDSTGRNQFEGGQNFTVVFEPVNGPFTNPCGKSNEQQVTQTDYGNGTYTIQYYTEFAGKYILQIQDAQNHTCFVVNQKITVSPGPVSAADSIAYGPGLTVGYLNQANTFRIQARDRFCNNLIVGGALFVIRVSGPGRVTTFYNDNGNGTYDVAYLPTVPGDYLISVTINSTGIIGSPFPISIIQAPASSLSYAYGSGLENGIAGVENVFVIQAVDQFGNDILVGGDSFNITISGPRKDNLGRSYSIIILKTDNRNGTYTVSWYTEVSGLYTIKIDSLSSQNGGPIIGSPYTAQIYPNVLSPRHSPVIDDMNEICCGFVAQTSTFLIYGRDRFSNDLIMGGDDLNLIFTWAENDEPADFTWRILDLGNGNYSVSFMTDVAGLYVMQVLSNHVDFIGSPFLVEIAPGGIICSESIAYGRGISVATSFDVNRFWIEARDYFGNPTVMVEEIAFSISFSQNGIDFPANSYTYTITDLGNGTYVADYIASANGWVNMYVYCRPGENIRDSPFLVLFYGDPCPHGPNGECNGHGACIGGECKCQDGYTGDDCSHPPAPHLIFVKFSDPGVELLALFDQPTDMANLGSQYFSCDKVIEPETTVLFGPPDQSYCYFRNSSLLIVVLANNATVMIGDPFILRNKTIKSADGLSAFAWDTKPVIRPDTFPVPVIAFGVPSMVNLNCEPLSLDTTGTIGTGGRIRDYDWHVETSTGSADYLNSLFSTNKSSLIIIDQLEPGDYNISVNYTNFFGIPSEVVSSVFTVVDDNVDFPYVSIDGTHTIFTSYNYDLSIKAKVFWPCSNDHEDVPVLEYMWVRLSGPVVDDLEQFGRASVLFLPGGSLKPGNEYEFMVSVGREVPHTTVLSDTVKVIVTPAPITPQILPYDRTVSRLTPIVLNAGNSVIDPVETYNWTWTCWNSLFPDASCLDPEGEALYLTNTPSIAFPSSAFHPGIYVFRVNISQGVYHASTEVHIDVVKENVPFVWIDGPRNSLTPPGIFRFQGYAESFDGDAANVTYEWSIFPNVNISDPNILLSEDPDTLVISAAGFLQGIQYLITFSTTDRHGTGVITYPIVIDESALAGITNFSTPTGNNQYFDLWMEMWEGERAFYPQRYLYYVVQGDGRLAPFATGPRISNSLHTLLPSGANRTVLFTVLDGLGGSRNISTSFEVNRHYDDDANVDVAKKMFDNEYVIALNLKDVDQVMQVMFIILDYLNYDDGHEDANGDQDLQTRQSIRENFALLLELSYNIELTTYSSNALAELSLAISQKPDELTLQTQLALLSITNKILNYTAKAGTDDTTGEAIFATSVSLASFSPPNATLAERQQSSLTLVSNIQTLSDSLVLQKLPGERSSSLSYSGTTLVTQKQKVKRLKLSYSCSDWRNRVFCSDCYKNLTDLTRVSNRDKYNVCYGKESL